MSDPDAPGDLTDDPDTVWLAGQPVDRAALETAQRILAGFEGFVPADQPVVPPWIVAARLAVRDALEEGDADPETDDG